MHRPGTPPPPRGVSPSGGRGRGARPKGEETCDRREGRERRDVNRGLGGSIVADVGFAFESKVRAHASSAPMVTLVWDGGASLRTCLVTGVSLFLRYRNAGSGAKKLLLPGKQVSFGRYYSPLLAKPNEEPTLSSGTLPELEECNVISALGGIGCNLFYRELLDNCSAHCYHY